MWKVSHQGTGLGRALKYMLVKITLFLGAQTDMVVL